MQGVDIYDPVTDSIVDTGAAKVGAWFVDGDHAYEPDFLVRRAPARKG